MTCPLWHGLPVRAYSFLATSPLATDDLVAAELRVLGADDVVAERGVVKFRGPLAAAYRACLWSRVANRVLLPIARFDAPDATALYEGARSIAWIDHLGPDDTLAVDVVSLRSAVAHTRFAAQRVKDAVVDVLRDRYGRRPNVETVRPRVRLHVRLERDSATVAIDLAGESLHRRGYRTEAAAAPLKENVAAALLLRARWPEAAAQGLALVDPLCGAGTLPIEAALIALARAPALGREYFGFFGWRGHDRAAWAAALAEAHDRARDTAPVLIAGYDLDPAAIRIAQANAERAGVGGLVRFEARPISSLAAPMGVSGGLVVANPPYGERLGEVERLAGLYADLGRALKQHFGGWSAHILTNNPELADRLPLAPDRTNTLWNGGLECRLYHYDIRRTQPCVSAAHGQRIEALPPATAGSEAIANRLRKNLRNLGSRAGREGITCYRLYDADIPEYAAAVDLYEGTAHVQEYAPPAQIDPRLARRRFDELTAAVREVLALPADRLFTKIRRPQKGRRQYEKLAPATRFHEVHEGGHRFLVSFESYLDTGLFLDHRLLRRLLGTLAPGRRFLDLFAYTGTATVYAARGGAVTTTSVDLSNTYLAWAERNLRLNGIRGRAHTLVRADCREWLARAQEVYDLIFLGPPTFSNSKRMRGSFDVQRDYKELVAQAASLLSPEGILLFSTNYRRFRMDPGAFADFLVEDLTTQTVPFDFGRTPRIHRSWRLQRRSPTHE